MKMKQRHLGKVFLLSIVTLGIYQIYWLVQTRREMMHSGTPSIPSVWILFAPALALLGVVSLSLLEEVLNPDGNGYLRGMLFSLGFFAMVAIFVVTPIWTWQYGIAVEALTGGETNRKYVFWMWVLVNIVSPTFGWIVLMQHEFNIVAGNKPSPKKRPAKLKLKEQAA